MKVILLNNNPAVSKLISMSLNKLGYEFAEIDNLETLASDNADLIICDSGLYDNQVDYLQYAKNQIFLLPRSSSDKYNLPKEQILQKPFLPTDLIDMINGILKVTPAEIKPTKQELNKPNDGIKIGNEFGEIQDIDDMEFGSGDDISDDELLDHDDKIEEKLVENEVKELKDDDLEQTADDISYIDDISDHMYEIEGEISEVSDDEISDEIDDDEIKEIDDDEVKEISDDEAINTSEIKDSDDKPSIQDITNEYKNIELDISALDDLPDDEAKSEPTIDVKEPKEIDDLDYTENLDRLSDMLDEIDNMDCDDESETIENEAKISDLNSSYNTIDEIDEAEIKAALNEDISQTLKEPVKSDETISKNENKDELAKVLATQISDEISKALSSSALKDILKDININVNISFKGDK